METIDPTPSAPGNPPPQPGPAGFEPPAGPAGYTPPAAPPGYAAPPAPAARPSGSESFFDSLRRSGFARGNDRWIGGVASGIAHRLGIDPLIVRGAFVVLSLFGGLSLLLYGLGWALIPEASDGRIHLQEAFRGRFDAALAGAAAFVVVGLSRPTLWYDTHRWGGGWFVVLMVGLLVTVGVIALIVLGVTHRTVAPSAPPAAPGGFAPVSSDVPTLFGGAPVGPTPSPGAPPATYPAPEPYPATPYPATAYPATAYPATAYPATAYPATAYPTTGGTPAPALPSYQGTAYVPPSPPPAPGPAVQPTWYPPQPPRTRAKGPGSVMTGIVLALCFLTSAGILLGHRTSDLTGSPALQIAGASLAILGLGVLVSGVRGRRSGVLGALALLVGLVGVPIAGLSTISNEWQSLTENGGIVVSDGTVWTPQTPSEAESGWAFSVGSAVIDTTQLTLNADATEPVVLPFHAGVGSTLLRVPQGEAIEVRVHLGAGEIRSNLMDNWTRLDASASRRGSPDVTVTFPDYTQESRTELSGNNLDVVLRSPAAGDPQLIVTIDAGLGDVTIEEVPQ